MVNKFEHNFKNYFPQRVHVEKQPRQKEDMNLLQLMPCLFF